MTNDNFAYNQAASQMQGISEMVADINCETTEDAQDAQERIQEHPLSVEVRSGWHSPGDKLVPEDFCILLCTGGPAVRIRGELDKYNEPCRAWLEYQDWGTPWTMYCSANMSENDLLAYSRCFYFGE